MSWQYQTYGHPDPGLQFSLGNQAVHLLSTPIQHNQHNRFHPTGIPKLYPPLSIAQAHAGEHHRAMHHRHAARAPVLEEVDITCQFLTALIQVCTVAWDGAEIGVRRGSEADLES